MAQVLPGRFTADVKDDFVVFLIGMRINKFWAVHKWLPVARSMGPMLKSLHEDPDSGFLSAEYFTNLRTACLLQYWRSSWQAFNRAVGSNGMVGIWHETYKVKAKEYECVYGNMPLFGLAKATEQIPAEGVRSKARSRISRVAPDSATTVFDSSNSAANPVPAIRDISDKEMSA